MKNVETMFNEFFPYAQKRLGFDKPVSLNLVSDKQNAQDNFGKTAYYDPSEMSITIYTDGRHPKDMLRSFSHELVHHKQNCEGQFNNMQEVGEDYAQTNDHLRNMEAEAYLIGNGFLVRDYTDGLNKNQMRESIKMNEQAIRSMTRIILEKLGDYPNMGLPTDLADEIPSQDSMADDPIVMKEKEEEEEDLDEAHCPGKRDDEEEDLDESHCPGKRDDEDELEEEAKPDFPDVDGDGDRKEPISKAQKDKKEKGGEDKEDKDYSKVPPQLRKHVQKESILDRQAALKEHVNGGKNQALFEKLVEKWCK